MSREEIKKKVKEAGQSHLFQHEKKLSPQELESLYQDLSTIDFNYANKIYAKTAEESRKVLRMSTTMERIPSSHINKKGDEKQREKWFKLGIEKISEGKVATLLLAGGQGTRLGTKDPKGMYKVGLLSDKSLYQLQAERLLRLQSLVLRLTSKQVRIPWYIMTSEATKERTSEYFRQHSWFGLNEEDVVIFEQAMIPCFTPEGKIILERKDKVARSPNGNGGVYEALRSQGVHDDMKKRGIEQVYQYCVDNILVKMADPTFIGYCFDKDADCAAKFVSKLHAKEPVGLICLKNGVPGVMEYSEIDDHTASRTNESGQLFYNESHICMNAFSVKFLNQISDKTSAGEAPPLPFHIAKKSIPSVDEKGEACNVNGWKLELFVFDVFGLANRFFAFEVDRNEEFSPLKNGSSASSDNPESCKQHLSRLHKGQAASLGASIDPTSKELFEISPLLSCCLEDNYDLESRVSGKTFQLPEQLNP
eukprot:TRINITY_DN5929_c0_g1_i4.p1 TRINITY_DN5929_c0_g1~~TRINITY_DN5929_c0_g1_i4.p1  ORF type:complete len:478 (+),score=103.06 TRINITY_DN5929_c0_g1_i4:189-1622(+)